MSNRVSIPTGIEKHLLQPHSLTLPQLEQVLTQTMRFGADYADLFLQVNVAESWHLEQSELRHGCFEENAGFGLRTILGEKTAFAYADGCALSQLERASAAVRAINAHGQDKSVALVSEQTVELNTLYPAVSPLSSLSVIDKQYYLQLIDSVIRAKDPRVLDVQCSLSANFESMLVLNHSGYLAHDVRPLCSLHVRVVLGCHGKRATGRVALGGRCDYVSLLKDFDPDALAAKVLHQAQVNLDAVPAPGGVIASCPWCWLACCFAT